MGLVEDILAAAPYFSLCKYLKRLHSSSSSVAKYTHASESSFTVAQ